MGRPSIATDELKDAICDRLAEGESLRSICRGDDMPDKSTILRWLEADDAFATKYARAREIATEGRVDEMVEIADDQNVPADQKRHMLETRRWMASKLLPKKYGDKLAHEHGGTDGGPIRYTVVTGVPEPEGG